MQRLVKDQESKEEKRLQKIQAQTEESLKECLFKPQLLTAGCPDYVTCLSWRHRFSVAAFQFAPCFELCSKHPGL